MRPCNNCGADTKNAKFCSRACSASFNNKNRPPRTIASRHKTSVANTGRISPRKGITTGSRLPTEPLYCRVSFCRVCGLVIKMSQRKTCSNACYRQHNSNAQTERLRQAHIENNEQFKRYRGKRSYMEVSFSQWLRDNRSIPFVEEQKILNAATGRYCYMDFFFPDIQLCIELDGTQHQKTKTQDINRDMFLTSLGITVLRITITEYKNKSKIALVQRLVCSGADGRS